MQPESVHADPGAWQQACTLGGVRLCKGVLMHQADDLPRLLRKSDLIGEPTVTAEQAAVNKAENKGLKRPRKGRPPLVPVSHATLWRWVREGRFPKPIKLSDRSTVWRSTDVVEWLKSRTG